MSARRRGRSVRSALRFRSSHIITPPALLNYRRGAPHLFLVAQKVRKGQPNIAEISELEKFLIQVAVARNPYLSNVHHTKQDKWSIDGVIRGKKGRNSNASGYFRKMMGL
jgi:hypothetical protein